MPQNKLALIRYKTIDQCLQNRQRKWTLDDLHQAVNQALLEQADKLGVSKRTIQSDIYHMRYTLGYDAPIEVSKNKYYTYTNPDYSIFQSPQSLKDNPMFLEALDVLKQLLPFQQFTPIADLIAKLDAQAEPTDSFGQRNNRYLQLDETEKAKGRQWINLILTAIRGQISLRMQYQSFKQDKPSKFVLFPYILKEYNNRWFVLGRHSEFTDLTLWALDRIQDLETWESHPYEAFRLDLNNYFDDCIGVSKPKDAQPVIVKLRVSQEQYKYLESKPLHPSQRVESKTKDAVVVSLKVIHNYELRQKLKGLSPEVTVLEPEELRNTIKEALEISRKLYD